MGHNVVVERTNNAEPKRFFPEIPRRSLFFNPLFSSCAPGSPGVQGILWTIHSACRVGAELHFLLGRAPFSFSVPCGSRALWSCVRSRSPVAKVFTLQASVPQR